MSEYQPEYNGDVIIGPDDTAFEFDPESLEMMGKLFGYELIESSDLPYFVLRPLDGDTEGLLRRLNNAELTLQGKELISKKLFPSCDKRDLCFERRAELTEKFLEHARTIMDEILELPSDAYNSALEKLSEEALSLREK